MVADSSSRWPGERTLGLPRGRCSHAATRTRGEHTQHWTSRWQAQEETEHRRLNELPPRQHADQLEPDKRHSESDEVTGWNPKAWSCWMDDFMGRLKKVVTRSRGRSMSIVSSSLTRYIWCFFCLELPHHCCRRHCHCVHCCQVLLPLPLSQRPLLSLLLLPLAAAALPGTWGRSCTSGARSMGRTLRDR